jgi:NitT/TauT family transport system permease protein
MVAVRSKAESAPDGTSELSGLRRAFRAIPSPVLSVLAFAIFVTAWQIVTMRELISPVMVPSPTAILNALADGLYRRGTYWPHIWSTVWAAVAGFGIAAASAVLTASALSMSRRLEAVVYPFIVAFQTLPKVAIAPLIVIWLGFGDSSKLAIVVVVCFFAIFMSALQGLRVRDRDQYQYLQTLGASRLQVLIHLRLPAATPYVFSGLHIGVVFALIGAVVAEFVGSNSGLGYVLLLDKSAFNVPGVFAILVILTIVGVTFNLTMRYIETKVAFWARDLSAPT